MTSLSTNTAFKIAKKYLSGKKLSEIEKLILLYTYYKELIEEIEDDSDINITLEEEIATSWVQALFEGLQLTFGNIDIELAAMSICGAEPPHK